MQTDPQPTHDNDLIHLSAGVAMDERGYFAVINLGPFLTEQDAKDSAAALGLMVQGEADAMGAILR